MHVSIFAVPICLKLRRLVFNLLVLWNRKLFTLGAPGECVVGGIIATGDAIESAIVGVAACSTRNTK